MGKRCYSAVAAGGLLVAWLGAACGSDQLRWVGAPSTRAVILFDFTVSGLSSGVAYEVSESQAQLVTPSPDLSRVYALGYRESLAELGLKAGPLTLTGPGLPLPTPSTIARLDVSGGSPGPWTALAEPPSEVRDITVSELVKCAAYATPTYFRLSGTERAVPTLLLKLDESRALIADSDGKFFEVSPDSARRLTELSTSTPHFAGFRRGDGELWLAGPNGRVAHGNPTTGFLPAPSLNHATSGLKITGAPAGQALELFALTTSLAIEHFDGQRWRVLVEESGSAALPSRIGLAWIGPGRVAVIGARSNEVWEVDLNGTITAVRLPVTLPDALFSIANLEGFGPIAASRYGAIFRRTDRWDSFPMLPTLARVDVMMPIDGRGFLAGGEGGELSQWTPEAGYCPTFVAGTGGSLDQGVNLGRDLVLAVSAEAERIFVAYLQRLR